MAELHKEETARAFRRLIISEDNRRILRGRLDLKVESLPASFIELLEVLDRQEQEEADEST